jgi:carbamoyl-phosphate synthase large subunit
LDGPYGKAYSSGFFLCPRGDDPEFVNSIRNFVMKENIDVVIPTVDTECVPLAKANEDNEILKGKIITSSYEAMKIASNKLEIYTKFKDYAPRFICTDKKQALRNWIDAEFDIADRFVMKNVVGSGSRGFRIITKKNRDPWGFLTEKPEFWATEMSFTEFNKLLMTRKTGLSNLLFSEYLPGKEYSVDFVCNDSHEVVSIVQRERVLTKLGVSTVARIVNFKAIRDIVEDVALELGLKYCNNIQLKKGRRGKFKIVDVNPRISGSIAMSCMSGPNLPEIALCMFLKKVMPERIEPRVGLMVYRHWSEVGWWSES